MVKDLQHLTVITTTATTPQHGQVQAHHAITIGAMVPTLGLKTVLPNSVLDGGMTSASIKQV